MMGHASEIISVDVYTDNTQIVTDCLDELEPFINLVKPKLEKKNTVKVIESNDLEIDVFIEKLLNKNEIL